MDNQDKKPDLYFLGIGTFKSATTFISRSLMMHPETCVGIGKEIGYFSKDKSLDWYNSHFNHAEVGQKKGEFSPEYFTIWDTPKRIYDLYPDIKLILCLRDPIERAYSHFLMEKYTNKVDRLLNINSFEEALDKNEFYVSTGQYYFHLIRFLKYFDRNQIHIIFLEDLKKDQKYELKKLYNFLELDDENFLPKMNKVNESYVPRSSFLHNINKFFYLSLNKLIKKDSIPKLLRKIIRRIRKFGIRIGDLNKKMMDKPTISKEDRKKFLKYFIDDIEKLEKLLEKDLSHWKK